MCVGNLSKNDQRGLLADGKKRAKPVTQMGLCPRGLAQMLLKSEGRVVGLSDVSDGARVRLTERVNKSRFHLLSISLK